MNASRFMRKGEAARRKPVTFDFLADDGLLLFERGTEQLLCAGEQ